MSFEADAAPAPAAASAAAPSAAPVDSSPPNSPAAEPSRDHFEPVDLDGPRPGAPRESSLRSLVNQAESFKTQRAEQHAKAMQAHAERQAKEFADFAQAEDKAFTEAIAKMAPEFKDPEKAAKLQEQTIEYLEKDLGIPRDALTQLWNSNPLFRSAKTQQLIFDGRTPPPPASRAAVTANRRHKEHARTSAFAFASLRDTFRAR